MKLSLSTWNSTNINDGSPFNAVIPQGQLSQLQLNPILVPRPDDYPMLSNAVKQGSVLAINVYVAAGQSINTARENLKKYFFSDNQIHNLVALDLDDSSKPYYRSGIAVGLSEEAGKPNSWIVRIQTEFPYWQLVTAATHTWNITATGQTDAVTNGGNLPVRPTYTLTPTTTKTAGYRYHRYIPIRNANATTYATPYEILDGSVDTSGIVKITTVSNQVNEAGNINASVTTWNIDTSVGGGLPTTGGMFVVDNEQCSYTSIAAGVISGVTRGIGGTTAATHLNNAVMYQSKMLANGADLRVWMDGKEVDRWIYNPTPLSVGMKVWINLTLAAKLDSTLLASINNSVQTLTFPQTSAGLAFLKGLKAATNTALKIESEIVTFDPANIDLINYQITSVVRAAKNTSAASHTAAVAVYYIEHDLFILYGDASATTPGTNDDNKPIISLNSTNSAWTWSEYFSTATNRPGAWKGSVESRSKLSYAYTADQNTFAEPATSLGLAERTSRDFTTPHETATIAWTMTHPAGITDIAYTASKYYTASWPGVVGLQYLQANTAWFTSVQEDAPAAQYTWETAAPASVSLGATYQSVRFVIDGTISSTIDEAALFQADSVTVTFDSTYLPVTVVGSEAAINFFDFKLTNTTTGLWLKIKAPCPLNKTLTINTDTKTAYLYDLRVVPVTLSTERAEWLTLSAGANTLQYDDTGTVAVTLVTDHRDKVL